MTPPECQEALGMENGAISDGQISASSEFSDGSGVYSASRARLYHQRTSYQTGGWLAQASNLNKWLQVDLGIPYKVTRVATQGQNAAVSSPQWVKSYKLQYKGENFQSFREQGQSIDKVESVNKIH